MKTTYLSELINKLTTGNYSRDERSSGLTLPLRLFSPRPRSPVPGLLHIMLRTTATAMRASRIEWAFNALLH